MKRQLLKTQFEKKLQGILQSITESVKSKDLEDKVINDLNKVNVKVTKNDTEACRRLGGSRNPTIVQQWGSSIENICLKH